MTKADGERGKPGYLFGGRLRTSTVALVIAFLLVWWVYDTYREPPTPPAAPQVVPPGFVPDPDYTWVPRTRLEQPPVTVTKTLAPSTVTQTVPPPTEPGPSPEWPFCPPICPPAPPSAPPAPPSAPPAPPSAPASAPSAPASAPPAPGPGQPGVPSANPGADSHPQSGVHPQTG